ncbi:GNAT family N-acetyltransferase [Nocardioides marmorisolisilvae]|uniref:GNAT family N-acetyltransferase n=1 Tax=Nocardioides marmorisolisilvae TaxID=1542737 RepID=A0A3N0DTP4_9ACTN|nr:GNAT family N-acetyltransferase [Nocardioides marmorisolisilvae]RNL78995.1 GNAT family N-acetyltransferase [Nocardioides marmorisolisilvae]
MHSRRTSYFVDEATAARIERAEAELMAACSSAVGSRFGVEHFQVAVRGGFATFAGADSPYNKVSGVGFAGIPDDHELSEMEARFAEHDAPVSFEVAALADPALVERLSSRGYRLVSFEDVLVRDLVDPPEVKADGVVVRREPADVDDSWIRAWLDTVVEASLQPDTQGLAQHEEFSREVLEQAELAGFDAGVRTYLALVDGVPAGGAGVRLVNGIAQMAGAGTVPAYRRRGVQTALVAARLEDAAAAGCDLAVVTTQPGSPSHANTQRMGFDLGYTRAVLVKEVR